MQLHIGFTGTRRTVTSAQFQTLLDLLKQLRASYQNFTIHHGMCMGADEVFHNASRAVFEQALKTIIFHPCDLKNHVGAFQTDDEQIISLDAKPPLTRNRDIVDSSDMMIAIPFGKEVLRSGTWSTVRYAKNVKRLLYIVRDDGTINVYN